MEPQEYISASSEISMKHFSHVYMLVVLRGINNNSRMSNIVYQASRRYPHSDNIIAVSSQYQHNENIMAAL